jgi:hypothetical protein
LPSACSGDMYATVPTIFPSPVMSLDAMCVTSSVPPASSGRAPSPGRSRAPWPARRRHHHVAGFQVAVRDAAGLRGRHRIGDFRADTQQPFQRQPAGQNQLAQRPAVHQLHRQEQAPVVFFDRMDGDNVRVVERGDRLRFALEALPVGGSAAKIDGSSFSATRRCSRRSSAAKTLPSRPCPGVRRSGSARVVSPGFTRAPTCRWS